MVTEIEVRKIPRPSVEEIKLLTEVPEAKLKEAPAIGTPNAIPTVDVAKLIPEPIDLPKSEALGVSAISAEVESPFIDVCRGTLAAKELKWYKVAFPRSFASKPQVFVTVEHRPGWKEWGSFNPPEFGVPVKEMAARENDPDEAYQTFYDKIYDYLETKLEEELPFGSKWMRFPIAWVGGMVAGSMAARAAKVVNVAFDDAAKGVNWTRERVNQAVSGSNWVGAVTSRQAEWAWNMSPDFLYSFSGRPGMKLTTAEVSDITTSSFKVLGYKNSIVHWVALGEPASPLDTLQLRGLVAALRVLRPEERIVLLKEMLEPLKPDEVLAVIKGIVER